MFAEKEAAILDKTNSGMVHNTVYCWKYYTASFNANLKS
jgi:hypothetical protein